MYIHKITIIFLGIWNARLIVYESSRNKGDLHLIQWERKSIKKRGNDVANQQLVEWIGQWVELSGDDSMPTWSIGVIGYAG